MTLHSSLLSLKLIHADHVAGHQLMYAALETTIVATTVIVIAVIAITVCNADITRH